MYINISLKYIYNYFIYFKLQLYYVLSEQNITARCTRTNLLLLFFPKHYEDPFFILTDTLLFLGIVALGFKYK